MSGPIVLVTAVGSASGARATAAALACAAAEPDRAPLLVDLDDRRASRPTLLATVGARRLEERLAAHLPGAAVASRGCLCALKLPPEPDALGQIAAALPLSRESAAVVHIPPHLLHSLLADSRLRPTAVLLRADLSMDRALTALAVRDLMARELRVAVLKRPLPWLIARAALFGALPASADSLPGSLGDRLLKVEG